MTRYYGFHSTLPGHSAVYKSWGDCLDQREYLRANNFNGKSFQKGFETLSEAERFAQTGPTRQDKNSPYAKQKVEPRTFVPKTHKARVDQIDYNEFAKTLPNPETTLVIYTDGSGRSVNSQYAQAGYGIWFSPNDVRNKAEPLLCDVKFRTAQRAELMAVVEALRMVQGEQRVVEIRSDSEYVVKGACFWMHDWKDNDWKTKGREGQPPKDVAHQDLWKELLRLQNNLFLVKYSCLKG